jgi:hypothetical protein
MPNGVAYDTHNSVSAPLQSDKYAFFRTTVANGGLNQNQYGTRSFVNATFGSNGTGSNLQDLKAQLAVEQLTSGFNEMFTFGSSFVSNVYNSVAGGVKEMGLRIADYFNTYAYTVSTLLTDGRYSIGYNGSFSQMGQMLDQHRTTWGKATLSAIPVAGAAYQAYSGQDLLTGQRLSGVDRVALGFAALGDAANFAALGVGLAERGMFSGGRAIENATGEGMSPCFPAGTPVMLVAAGDPPQVASVWSLRLQYWSIGSAISVTAFAGWYLANRKPARRGTQVEVPPEESEPPTMPLPHGHGGWASFFGQQRIAW